MNLDPLAYLQNLLNLSESNPDFIANKLLNAVAKSYTTANKNRFANIEFIANLIAFHGLFASQAGDKFSRNCILVIRHVCQMYQFYPDNAFDFAWQFRHDKKLAQTVAMAVFPFPQLVKQADWLEFLLFMATTAPKKQAISLLHSVLLHTLDSIENAEYLQKFLTIFEDFIQKYPDLYQSIHEYPVLVEKIKKRAKAILSLDYQANDVVLGAERLKAIEQGRADYRAGKLERLEPENALQALQEMARG